MINPQIVYDTKEKWLKQTSLANIEAVNITFTIEIVLRQYGIDIIEPQLLITANCEIVFSKPYWHTLTYFDEMPAETLDNSDELASFVWDLLEISIK